MESLELVLTGLDVHRQWPNYTKEEGMPIERDLPETAEAFFEEIVAKRRLVVFRQQQEAWKRYRPHFIVPTRMRLLSVDPTMAFSCSGGIS